MCSPKSLRKVVGMPTDCSWAACALRILEAATIFMAEVIFLMFWTDLILDLTARGSNGAVRTCTGVGQSAGSPERHRAASAPLRAHAKKREGLPAASVAALRAPGGALHARESGSGPANLEGTARTRERRRARHAPRR